MCVNNYYLTDKHFLIKVTSTITAQSKELMPDLSKLTLPTATATTSSGRGPRPLEVSVKCKHCELFFSTYHNYKTHLIAKHLAPERYILYFSVLLEVLLILMVLLF